MSDWQERITRDTAPAIRVEHELRYRIAAPLVASSAVWADLGCGNGVAAAAAFGQARPGRAVLVDVDADAVQQAARELGMPDALGLTCDLTDPRELERIGDALLDRDGNASPVSRNTAPGHTLSSDAVPGNAVPGDTATGGHAGGRVVSCFEVVEHLSSFVPLLEWAGELARSGHATFVISVPNDAFWSIQNPHHQSAWGEGAFEELRRLLPPEHTLLRQVALSGSAALHWDGAPERFELSTQVGGEGTVTTHYLAAFGPLRRELWHGALCVQTDTLAQRRWERQRESDLAVMQRIASEHDRTVAELRAELQQRIAWLEDWRTYIHQLERELNRPLSGLPENEPTGRDAAQETPGDAPQGDDRPSTTRVEAHTRPPDSA